MCHVIYKLEMINFNKRPSKVTGPLFKHGACMSLLETGSSFLHCLKESRT